MLIYLQSRFASCILTRMATLPKATRDYLASIGARGGKARLTRMTPEQRSEVARRGGLAKAAARARKPEPA